MQVRFYISPATRLPHIEDHGVSEDEAEDVLSYPLETGRGRDGTRVTIGQTAGGRFLRVIHVPNERMREQFVITAYELGPRALQALRTRLRRRR